jgi:hypothetical protein
MFNNYMLRLFFQAILLILLVGCTETTKAKRKSAKLDHPEISSSKTLPQQIRIVGTIRELSPGYCGTICEGGYIKVELDSSIPDFNFKSVYAITACLASGIEPGLKVDVIATLHTGKETECYYQNFDRPKDSQDYVFYKLSERETSKIHK